MRMLTREHFPCVFYNQKGEARLMPQIPPFHREIAEHGLSLEMVVSVLDTAIRDTKLDLEEISAVGYILHVEHPARSWRPVFKEGLNERYLWVWDTPFIGRLLVTQWKISAGAYTSYIRVDGSQTSKHNYFISKGVSIPKELREEYEMEIVHEVRGYVEVSCPKRWRSHNPSGT